MLGYKLEGGANFLDQSHDEVKQNQSNHRLLSTLNSKILYYMQNAVTGKFIDFPVCVIRNIFIRKISHLTISSPFISINQKMHKNHSSF